MASRSITASREPRLTSQVVRVFLACHRMTGRANDELLRRYDLTDDAETAPEVELPLASLHALTDEVAASLGASHLGLQLAKSIPRGSYGLIEFIARSSPTLREAARRVTRYTGLLNDVVVATFDEHEDRGRITQRIPGMPLCVGTQPNEMFLAVVVRLVRDLLDRPWVPPEVRFAHRRPTDLALLIDYFGPHLEFDCGANQVAIEARDLDHKLAGADEALLATLEQQAQRMIADRPTRSDGLAWIREHVRLGLRDGTPQLQSVAAKMQMSARTLQRRLAAEGTSFQAVLDEVREELARMYMARRDLALGEVAYLLGFSELSAFVRAFRRWTGQSPGEFRSLLMR
jgi:AraC-like DNA-binding protein